MFLIKVLQKLKAKKPNTIVGMPANISRIGLIIRLALSLAYSLK